jgi:hypothetical protein
MKMANVIELEQYRKKAPEGSLAREKAVIRSLLGRMITGVEVNSSGDAYIRFHMDDGREFIVQWDKQGLAFGASDVQAN